MPCKTIAGVQACGTVLCCVVAGFHPIIPGMFKPLVYIWRPLMLWTQLVWRQQVRIEQQTKCSQPAAMCASICVHATRGA